MNNMYFDLTNLQVLLFERRQIVALLENTEIWRKIPLDQRFAIVDSSEFITLMGKSFTEQTRHMLESEIEALIATIH